jgi:hypothetical protein
VCSILVPIIPDYLYTLEGNSSRNGDEKDENGRVGLLLSSKAFVQLILNPAVGTLTGTFGYAKPLLLGNLSLLLAALRKEFTFIHLTVLSIFLFILFSFLFISRRNIYPIYISIRFIATHFMRNC